MRAAITVLCCLPLFAQETRLSAGYDHFYNLEYDQAIAGFAAATADRPGDPNAWNHLAHAILYRAMFRSGALESELVTGSNPFLRRDKVKTTPAEDRQFDDAIDKAVELSKSKLAQNSDEPAALNALGIAYGLRANYGFLVRKAWMDALHDATDAHKAHKRLSELEPDNVDARLILGVYDYLVGSLSFGYRLLGFLAGYRGNRDRGIRTLQTVAQNGVDNRVDAEIVLAAIYRRERRPQAAIPLLEDLVARFPRNYLLRFEFVQMYSDLGDKEHALSEIEHIRELQRTGAPGFVALAPEKVDYLEGNFRFWYNDLDAALDLMKIVTAKASELDLNTGVMSWMRLGQVYDLKGRHASASAAYRKAIAMAPQSDVAKESRDYISRPYRRRQEPAATAPSREGGET